MPDELAAARPLSAAREPTTESRPGGPPESPATGPAPASANPPDHGAAEADLETVRRVLVGPERERLAELSGRLDSLEVTPADIADVLPEAIALRSGRDRQLGLALAPTVETALRQSIHRNPREIAAAIFPVLGPAIRKAIAEAMAGLVRSINRAVEHSLSPRGLKWRLEAWRTGVPYTDIVILHALVYRVEQVFLIHAETGLLLQHVSAPDLKVPDADLISSMLTAIQDFVRDSFRPGEGATLSTFTVGEHTVQVEAGPRALVAAVIRGQAPESVTRRLQTTLESIHLEFAAPLAEFTGDATPFVPARPLLEECLVTVLSTERNAGRGGRAWMQWAIPVALVAVALAVVGWRSQARWERARAALESEPGVVIVDAERGWRRWSFRGLRDPLAREPGEVLTEAGLTPPKLLGTWEPYLSLDSAIVTRRARQALGVPDAVTATLSGDTLRLGGPAPLDWIAVARRSLLPMGIARLDFTDVRPALPEPLDSLRRAIEGARVLFAPGSAALGGDGPTVLRGVALAALALAADAADAGFALRLTLIGRTDPTGSDEANQALAQWRVDRVSDHLSARGIATTVLVPTAVATARPLPAESTEARARVNRSVSFEVTFESTPPRTTAPR